MRILIVSTDSETVPPLYYGGIERIVYEVAAGLVGRGHEVSLLAVTGSDVKGAECRFWRKPGILPDSVVKGAQAMIAARHYKADLVHNFGQAKWLIPWGLLGGKAVMSYQVLPQVMVKKIVQLFGQRMLLTGCSDYIARHGVSLIRGEWRRVYNCIPLARYHFVKSVPGDAPLVFLSRIDPIKGTHLAIDAAVRAGRRLIVAGNHHESGESGRYWREVVKPRLTLPGVEYVGPVNDEQKNRLLGNAAAMIVPIQWDEPFGIVFIESLACGTPVISCPRGALPEIVRDNVEGMWGETLDELTDSITRIGQIDRKSCRQRVEECFSTERIVREYEQLYQEVVFN